MKSTNQYRAKSTPKHVTLKGGPTPPSAMATSRATPTTKTAVKIYPQTYRAS